MILVSASLWNSSQVINILCVNNKCDKECVCAGCLPACLGGGRISMSSHCQASNATAFEQRKKIGLCNETKASFWEQIYVHMYTYISSYHATYTSREKKRHNKLDDVSQETTFEWHGILICYELCRIRWQKKKLDLFFYFTLVGCNLFLRFCVTISHLFFHHTLYKHTNMYIYICNAYISAVSVTRLMGLMLWGPARKLKNI